MHERADRAAQVAIAGQPPLTSECGGLLELSETRFGINEELPYDNGRYEVLNIRSCMFILRPLSWGYIYLARPMAS